MARTTKTTVRRERTIDGEEVTVLGAPRSTFGDLYHAFLRASWPRALGWIVAVVVGLDAAFAVLYAAVGGVTGARSFFDYFAFSVETMSTIGYGEMHPDTPASHVLVMVQAIVGLLVTALATGLVFAKFAQPSAKIAFSDKVVVGAVNGVPTLSIRLGNERSNNRILEATIRLTLVRTERHDGKEFYRMYDVPLTRERAPALTRAWIAMHTIDDKSLLHGATPESLLEDEIELLVTVIGTDDVSFQPVHARRRYLPEDFVFGGRFADMISFGEGGSIVLDMHKFHLVERTGVRED